VAHSILNRCIPFRPKLYEGTEDINLIERNLDRTHMQFTGMAADLDNLRRHYRQTLNNLPIGVCSLGRDGELLIWNRAMENITGISSLTVLGSHLDSIPQPWCDILTKFATGEKDSVMKHQVGASNSDNKSRGLWISLHRAAIAASADTDSGSDIENNQDRVILVEDISHSELLEEELIHSERLASIGRLAAGVAHEIGNPVTGIACLAQNLEYETEPTEIRHMAHDILTQTDRVSRIVESLVNFSHTGSTSSNTNLSPSNLADCVDEAINLLQLDHEAKPVMFNNHCDRELVVLADSQRLLQVFINLLGNARDACLDEGHVSIRATRDEDLVTIDIEDNGCGVQPHLLNQVFEPFFTTKDPGKGTGLGLALVYSIMEDMNGSVHLESPLNEGKFPGTRVSLQLPGSEYTEDFLT
jgi:signal transduction histidine kinase